MNRTCLLYHFDRPIPYLTAWEWQKQLVEERKQARRVGQDLPDVPGGRDGGGAHEFRAHAAHRAGIRTAAPARSVHGVRVRHSGRGCVAQ